MRSANYHRARAKTLRAVDRKLAEPVLLFPLKDGVQDPDREKVELIAVLRENASNPKSPTGGVSGDWRVKIQAGSAELSVSKVEYPDLIARKGDTVRALAREGEPNWRVEYINKRNQARWILELTEL